MLSCSFVAINQKTKSFPASSFLLSCFSFSLLLPWLCLCCLQLFWPFNQNSPGHCNKNIGGSATEGMMLMMTMTTFTSANFLTCWVSCPSLLFYKPSPWTAKKFIRLSKDTWSKCLSRVSQGSVTINYFAVLLWLLDQNTKLWVYSETDLHLPDHTFYCIPIALFGNNSKELVELNVSSMLS